MIFTNCLLTPTEVIELITEHKTSYYKINNSSKNCRSNKTPKQLWEDYSASE
jgi:hypothetical protein